MNESRLDEVSKLFLNVRDQVCRLTLMKGFGQRSKAERRHLVRDGKIGLRVA